MFYPLKYRRMLSYHLNKWDDKNLEYTIDTKDVKSQVVDFFKHGSKLVYPAKSYFVAIVYAKCMEKYFNQDFYVNLDDFELLVDDKYFVTYSNDQKLYDEILEEIGDIWQYESINKTVEYFKKEYMVDEMR